MNAKTSQRNAEARYTHCVTFCRSRLHSVSLLTIARSPPRSEHCCRASVQLNSPGTIWKQRDDWGSYTLSFGQYGEAGRGQKHSHNFLNLLTLHLEHHGAIHSWIYWQRDMYFEAFKIHLFYIIKQSTMHSDNIHKIN